MTESLSPGSLYIVPTPIGNLEDITLRALRALREVDFIAAEDTRRTRKLLSHFDIHPAHLFSYREHNRVPAGEETLRQLRAGKSGALVSDAGMPGISDPGAELVRLLIDAGLSVTVLPGATAFATALVGSGLSTTTFSFYGFLPRDAANRRAILRNLRHRRETLIFYESPHRMAKTLADLLSELGDRAISVARELSKVHEEYMRGGLRDLAEGFRETGARGEFVIVVSGCDEKKEREREQEEQEEVVERMSVADAVLRLEEQGAPRKEAMRSVARDRGLSRRDVYRELLSSTKQRGESSDEPPDQDQE